MSIEQLYKTLDERRRPEDVAQMIVELAGDSLALKERAVLERAARGSLARNMFGYTSMAQTFATVVGAEKQINKAIEIFQLDIAGSPAYNKADEIEKFINLVSPVINKPVGQNDFKIDRLNKEQRAARGIDISKRNYNKKWRLLKRIEEKLQRLIRETRKLEFQKVSKHGLAHTISLQEFSSDMNTACFMAYYNARCNVRSVFTNQSQDRPFDEICGMLLGRCRGEGRNTTNWWAIAHLYTSQEVLAHLPDERKGLLLGKWTTILQEIAGLLDEVWKASHINRQTMIVRRGNDSSTWNNTAGAWNKARDNWMNLIYALGLDYLLDEICFGKVMRLMAGDVAAWHLSSGDKLDPDTEVWNKIPLPWEVFQSRENCNRELVIQYCNQAGLDAEKSGWIAPRVHGITEFKPTPELVHGIAVANPFLATVVKRHKYFSGKGVKPIYPERN